MLLQLAVAATVFLSLRFKDTPFQEEVAPIPQDVREVQEVDQVYCSTNVTGEVQEGACVPCPDNAECTEGSMTCNPGYRRRNRAKTQGPHIAPERECVEDLESKARAAEALEILTELLKERQGRYECGLPLDPLFSPSDQLGEKPWSKAIKKMCSGPGVTRWQMHFHPDIAPAIADEGVYFWLFYHFLTAEAAAEIDIQVRNSCCVEPQNVAVACCAAAPYE